MMNLSNWQTRETIHVRRFTLGLCAAAILVLGTAACNLPGSSPTATTAASTASLDSDEPTAAGNAIPAVEEPVTNEAPLPAGLVDVLSAGVESGAWSYEQGLINALKLFTGEFDPSGIWDELPTSFEGTGIIREAQRYLREGTDPQVRLDIESLLAVIAPPSERLLEAAEPESSRSSRLPGLAANRLIGEECSKLYKDGFPAGSNLKCLLYKEGGISGQTVRVYYPLLDMPLDYGDAAFTGIMTSFQTFAKLTSTGQPPQMKGIDLLFVVLPEIEDPSTLAMVPSGSTDDRCLIVVYLGAIEDNELNKGGPDDYGRFLQTIAHEMFHCYQVWNFPAQADANWKVQDWWGEGTATYFSNVVYPEINVEWEWTSAFAYRSADTPLTEMAYENSLFFQYIANQQGDAGVLNIIKAMPAQGNEAAQAAALGSLSNMQTLFHDFGRALIDGEIIDTSKQTIPTLPAYIQAEHQIVVKEANIRTLDAKPFVLSRYAITFSEGHSYNVSRVLTGSAEGYDAARIDVGLPVWTDLPEKVIAGCGPVTYYVLLTSAPTDGGAFAIEFSMIPDEELGCDECLIGTWDVDVPFYVDELTSLMPSTESDQFNVDFAGGVWQIEFTKQAVFTGTYNFATLYSIFQVNAPFGNNIQTNLKLSIEGDISSLYAADGIGHMQTSLLQNNLNFEQEIIMNGDEIPVDDSQFSDLFSPSASSNITYSCDEDTLYLNFAPDSVLGPLKYNRQ
ncbi:MAG: hypothetical protein E4G99_00675 [Anaerolineales bacterium]|nr:MAG: hypothetical protein E4G99_00675 [Anaerolineales bacterium]